MNLILQRQRKFFSFVLLVAFLTSLLGKTMPASSATPPAPVIIAPAAGVTVVAFGSGDVFAPPTAIPEFIWEPVAGTTNYRLQISDNIGFSTTVVNITTPLTKYIPPLVSSLKDGEWYWRVRVDSPTVSEWSEQPNHRSFIKQWASPENKPILVSPDDYDTLEYYDAPAFSWQPVVGAASYRFQIDESSTFSSPTTYVTLATTFQPTTKLANGTYFWRVIPIDPADRDGTPSDYRTFQAGYGQGGNSDLVPIQLSPANTSNPTFTPTFRWTAVRGAQTYRLEYSTDPTLTSGITGINTNNTTYTPTSALPNDVDYYWHIRAQSGSSISDWSPTWKFKKQWYIKPVLLTPTNLFPGIRIPSFSWSPVPGASYYKIELANNVNITTPFLTATTSNTFYSPQNFNSDWKLVYWRVTPYEPGNIQGMASEVFSFTTDPTNLTPELISPLYFYLPNDFPPPYETVEMQPHADWTASLPVFSWHHLTAFPGGETAAEAYKLQVSISPFFSPVDTIKWEIITQNTHAAPTVGDNFIPEAGQEYFWRVRGLDINQNEIGNWSQVWLTHISLQTLAGATTAPPQLRRPVSGTEVVEATPLFEWWPVIGADNYEVQISLDPTFASVVNSDFVLYPVYSPLVSLAQRSLGILNYGTYYWRVQARVGTIPLGDWSQVWRFQIASQSGRMQSRTLGNVSNRMQIANDTVGDASALFDLTTLYASQDSNYWFFGFNTAPAPANMTYILYFDKDHQDGSGGTFDPLGFTISTISIHRPEYVVYINIGDSLVSVQTALYTWNGTGWGFPTPLASDLLYTSESQYLELKIPITAIGMNENTGSYALSLFSAPSSPGAPMDSAPSSANIPGSGLMDRFTSVSERMNAIQPANTQLGDPAADPFFLSFQWDYPAVSEGMPTWKGVLARVYLDEGFTNKIAEFSVNSTTAFYSSVSSHWANDLSDNTYFWRIKPVYTFGDGVWSQGQRFTRRGFLPTNLTESVNFATPTFSWSRVEGASSYKIQVGTDSMFNTGKVVDTSTTQNSYTPTNTLNENVIYYWRLSVVRQGSASSEWTAPRSFTFTLPKPTGLTVNGFGGSPVISTTPTFCWQPIVQSENGIPVLAAYRYRIQASKDPTFTSKSEYDTEQNCYTPTTGYSDGSWYWRVAMYDGQNKLGGFSEVATFNKQYPMAKPLSPINGSTIGQTPTFIWTAMDGVTPYVLGASSYKFESSLNINFSPTYESVTTNNSRYTPTKKYDPNKQYYWRVAIIDKNSNIGPFNTATMIIDPYPIKVYLPLVKK